MSNQQNYCDRYRCTRSGDLLVLCRRLWIQGHKKKDAICCLNCSRKCYSDCSRSRYATRRTHDKGSWSRKRCGIKSYSYEWYTIKFCLGCNPYAT
ncbi:hypothetical protein Peur_056040 [Populus x canadensis]